MPGLRDNARKTLNKNTTRETTRETEQQVQHKRGNARKKDSYGIPTCKEDYSDRSPVLKAYAAGKMPVDHEKLLEGIKRALGGSREGDINLGEVLKELGIFRASALKMLRHMQNFGVLESESHYQGTWVRILRDK